MRKKYIAGNWKMNTSVEDGSELAKKIADGSSSFDDNVQLVIAPPFVTLHAIHKIVSSTKIELAAQNVATEDSGAYTGEISASMLKSVGVGTVIVGHSERRIIYKESNAEINKKGNIALSQSLKVILCVGETLEEREAGKVNEIVDKQLIGGLASVDSAQMTNVIIAYEPVWAIGTGKTASPEEANEVHQLVRKRIKELYNEQVAQDIIILYGGSVKPDNAQALFSKEDIDGALIGGASLSADSFLQIARA